MNVLPALMISLVLPLGFLYLIYKLDLYETGKLHYNVIAISGGMVGSLLALLLHSSILGSGLLTEMPIIRSVAPFSEELLKALILFHLVRRADFNYVVDGAIYGAGAGFGFAMAETFVYVLGASESATSLALNRAFSANLIHATTTGLVGSALAAGQVQGGVKRVFISIAGLAAAMGLHMGYNFMVTAGTSLIPAIAAGFLGIALIILIIEGSLRIQRRWIAETLGMTDQVTAGESAVVQRIQNMD
jgi:RsiW-degrading membrane proteinase PrsW (M82 family)